MSASTLKIEKRQRDLRLALLHQSRVPLMSSTEKAIYDQYVTYKKVIDSQLTLVKSSIMLCKFLLDVYSEYISRLEKLYGLMNEFEGYVDSVSQNLLVDPFDSKTSKTYTCWLQRMTEQLRETNEFPKNQQFCNELLFYNKGSPAFKTKFTFIPDTGNSTISTQSTNFGFLVPGYLQQKEACECNNECDGVFIGNVNVAKLSWEVHNFDNNPISVENFPLDTTFYSEADLITYDSISNFIAEFTLQYAAVFFQIARVKRNKDVIAATLVSIYSIESSTQRTLEFVDDMIESTSRINPEEIQVLIETGTDLKNTISALRVSDSRLRLFSGNSTKSNCFCD